MNIETLNKFPFPGSIRVPKTLAAPINALVEATGYPGDVVTMAVLAVLAGLAPRHACITTEADLNYSLKFNLCLSGGDGTAWKRFRELLSNPVVSESWRMQEQARLVDLERLRKRMKIAEWAYGWALPEDFNSLPSVVPSPQARESLQPFLILLQPTFFLRECDAPSLESAIPLSFDRTLLVDLLDSPLVEDLLHSRPPAAATRLATLLSKCLNSSSVKIDPGKGSRWNRSIEHPRLSLLLGARPDQIAALIGGETAGAREAARLLRHCVIVPADPVKPPVSCSPSIVSGLQAWRELVAELVVERRRLTGNWMMGGDPYPAAAFQTYFADLRELEESLPPHLHAMLGPLVDLPMRLWGILEKFTATSADSTQQAAEALARGAVRHHVQTLSANPIANARQEASADDRMMGKLVARGPMTFRDLLRTYSCQRREEHKQTLERLLEDGKVRLNEAGLLEANICQRRTG